MAPAPVPVVETASATELASRLRLVVTRLRRRLRHHAGGRLTPSQASALSSVERHGPMTLGELSAVENVRPPTLTKVVAALEEQGLVARHTDAQDRRVARVETTAKGARLLAEARSRTDAYLATHLAALPADDLDALRRAVAALEH
ncbi:MAG: MarR family transcriptional regulator, partial [Actinomycetota bacterium]|nr:MarR family transcriptional regulator [Actinomycetota bacterium]